MNNNIKSIGSAIVLLALALVLIWGAWTLYATHNKTEQPVTPEAPVDERIYGQWNIMSHINVALDADEIEPDHRDHIAEYYIRFEKDTNQFVCTTDCNTISGSYHQSGDSLTFSDMMMTEMACDDMTLEDCMKGLLPLVSEVVFKSDTCIYLKDAFGRSLVHLNRAN